MSRTLVCRGVSKTYPPAVRALDSVDLELRPGEIHGLIGANGAGKSTLIGILAGAVSPGRESRLLLEEEDFAPSSVAEARSRGVRWVAQELRSIETLTVAENLFLAELPRALGWIDRAGLRALARDALAGVGLEDLDPNCPVASLNVGERQLIEIAGALYRGAAVPKLLLLDEPTAALTTRQAETLFERLEEARAAGASVLYVTHRLDEVLRLADRVTVLVDGSVAERVELAENAGLSADDLVDMMSSSPGSRRVATAGDGRAGARVPCLSLSQLVCRLGDPAVDLTFSRGEICGLFGLVGAGRSRLLKCLAGAERPASGRLELATDGQALRSVELRQPRDAARLGVVLVPEDRKGEGLLLPIGVGGNVTLSSLRELGRSGWLMHSEVKAAAEDSVRRLEVKCDSLAQPIAELSGGNQQKALLARSWLHGFEVLLLDKPTRGVDVASRRSIYRQLQEFSRGEPGAPGAAVVVASNEAEEIFDLCDRVVVLSAGAVTLDARVDEVGERELLDAAFKYHVGPSALPTGAAETVAEDLP